jgi:hypothetical protein
VLLAILIHVTREGLSAGRSERRVLKSLSQFDIRNTAAELQHEFCALWNEIIQAARNEGGSSNTPSTQALSGIRRLFAALHQGTDPASTRFCDVPGHRPDLSTPVSATTSPSVPPRTQQSDSAIASPHPALASQPPLANASDVATEDAMPGNTDISDAAYPIRGFSGDPTQGQVEETSEIAPSAAFGSLPTSPLSNRTPIELSSTIDSALTQPSHHPYAAAYVDSAATPHTNSPPTQPSNPTQASPRLALTSQPPLAASLPDVTTEDEMQGNADASVISNTTDPMRGSTSGDGPAPADLQQAEETRTISPPSVFASLPTPISSPALSSQFPARLPTAIDPAVTHTDHVPAASSSPSTTAPLSGSTRVTTISDQCRSLAGAQGDTQGTQEVHTRSPPGGDTAL